MSSSLSAAPAASWRKEPVPLAREILFFCIASLLDFVMTIHLLQLPYFEESNPVARWFLEGHGIWGMAAFKAFMVAFVTGLCMIIFRLDRRAARRTLNLGTSIVAATVVYGICLRTFG